MGDPSPDLARLLAANPDLVVEDTDPLGSVGLLRFPGGSAAHFAIAIGQRGWKRQPEAGARALARRQAKSGHMIQTMHHSPGPRACHIFRSLRGPTLLVRSQSAACCSVPADCVA